MSTDNPHTPTHTQTSPLSPPTAAHHDTSTVLAREPCAGCGAPLGADQRYCLSCGIPRTGTRLPFLDVLHAEASSAGIIERGSQPAALLRMPALASAGGSKPTHPGGWWDGKSGVATRLRDNTGLFALLGVLLLALLIGLLLGHWVSAGSKNIAAAPSRQVIEVKGLNLPAAAAVGGSQSSGVAGSSASSAASESSTSSAAAHTSHATHASNPAVSSLAQSTGKEHAKAVERLSAAAAARCPRAGRRLLRKPASPGPASRSAAARKSPASNEDADNDHSSDVHRTA